MFTKLYQRITESSLMEEDIKTRYAFVILLAIASPQGYVIGTDVALARRLNMDLVDFQGAVERLSAPDPNSNSKDEDGRRLIPSDGERGYKIVNYLKYRSFRDEDHRREYQRDYMAEYRAEGRDKSRPVNSGKLGKTGNAWLAQAEAEAEAEKEGEVDNKLPSSPAGDGSGEDSPFDRFWKAYPKKVGKADAKKAFEKKKCKGNIDQILAAIESQKRSDQWCKDGGQFIPHPTTWLNRGGWDDEPIATPDTDSHHKEPWCPTKEQQRLNKMFQRPDTQRFTDEEIELHKRLTPIPEEDLSVMEEYRAGKIDCKDVDRRSQSLPKLLSKWSEQMDYARAWVKNNPKHDYDQAF